jgi:hypothetical protein
MRYEDTKLDKDFELLKRDIAEIKAILPVIYRLEGYFIHCKNCNCQKIKEEEIYHPSRFDKKL